MFAIIFLTAHDDVRVTAAPASLIAHLYLAVAQSIIHFHPDSSPNTSLFPLVSPQSKHPKIQEHSKLGKTEHRHQNRPQDKQ